MIKKFCKSILAFILALSFVMGLFPIMSVRAADPYGKVDKTYNHNFEYDTAPYTNRFSLSKGYTDIHKFTFEREYSTMSCLCITLYSEKKASCDVKLEDENGKTIFEKKACAKDYYKILFLDKGNYKLKVRAREKTGYHLELKFDLKPRRLPIDIIYTPNKKIESFIDMDSINFIDDYKEETIKSPLGKVTWYKEFYNKKSSKYTYKKLKTATSLKVTSKDTGDYVFKKNGVVFRYSVNVVSPFDSSKQNYTAKYLSAGCNVGYALLPDGPDETTPYYVRLYGYNNSKKTITKITVKADDLIYTQKELVRPYQVIEFTKGKKGERAHYLQKVVYTYADGTKETIFNGEQYIFNVREV